VDRQRSTARALTNHALGRRTPCDRVDCLSNLCNEGLHRDGFDKLDAKSKAGLAAAISNANAFYCAMARITDDAMALTA
jgi:hypothetical protein